MSKLSSLKLPTFSVNVGDTELTFKALGFNDITALISSHREELELLYSKASKGDGFDDLITVVLKQFPDLAASVIAHSNGDPEATDAAASLAAPLQLVILENIIDMTFNEVGGVGKFLPLLRKMFAKVTMAVSNLNSNTGTSS